MPARRERTTKAMGPSHIQKLAHAELRLVIQTIAVHPAVRGPRLPGSWKVAPVPVAPVPDLDRRHHPRGHLAASLRGLLVAVGKGDLPEARAG